MTRWTPAIVAAAVLLVGGCHRSAPDPVPPAPSGGLAPAPPDALGARAAGLGGSGSESASPLARPPHSPPPAPGGSAPAPPALAPPPPGSGVAL